MRRKKLLVIALFAIGLCILYYAVSLKLWEHDGIKIFQVKKETLKGSADGTIPPIPTKRSTLNLSEDGTFPSIGDYGRLMDLRGFRFLHEPLACDPSQHTQLLALVHSAPDHTQLRNTIRTTWGAPVHTFRTVFVLGAVRNQSAIDVESAAHGDILQGSFVDAYRNMTYKHVALFKWLLYNCPTVEFVLKTDDDYYVNTPRLISALPYFPTKRLIFCGLIHHSKVFRDKGNKWFVTTEEYSEKEYPLYCMGPFIVYTLDSVLALYSAAQQSKYLFVDDAFVTGILAQKVGIERLGDIQKPGTANNVTSDIKWPVNRSTFSGTGQFNVGSDAIIKMYNDQYGLTLAATTTAATTSLKPSTTVPTVTVASTSTVAPAVTIASISTAAPTVTIASTAAPTVTIASTVTPADTIASISTVAPAVTIASTSTAFVPYNATILTSTISPKTITTIKV